MTDDLLKALLAEALKGNPQLVRDALAMATSAPPPTPATKKTFGELWAEYSSVEAAQIKSWDGAQASHEHHILPFFGHMAWDAVDWDALDAYRAKRRTAVSENGGGPISAATRNRELTSVKTCLSWALKRKKIPYNPARGAPDEDELNQREAAPTAEEVQAVIENAHPAAKPIIGLLWFTGCRRDEIRALMRTQVVETDVKRPDTGEMISIRALQLLRRKTKTKKSRLVPLPPEAQRVLDQAPWHLNRVEVFPNHLGKKGPVAKRTLHNWFTRACKDAGLEYIRGEKFTIHHLRHGRASDLAARGMQWPALKQGLGWETDAMAGRYQHLGPQGMGAIWLAMSDEPTPERKGPIKAPRPTESDTRRIKGHRKV